MNMDIKSIDYIFSCERYLDTKKDYQKHLRVLKNTLNPEEVDIQDLFDLSLESVYMGEELRLNATSWFDECIDDDALLIILKGQMINLGSLRLAMKSESFLQATEGIGKLNNREEKDIDHLSEYAQEFSEWSYL